MVDATKLFAQRRARVIGMAVHMRRHAGAEALAAEGIDVVLDADDVRRRLE